MTQHGMSGTATYCCWANMKYRCNNPNSKKYSDYGGRGIRVCERWNDFKVFFADMGEKPHGLTLDRKDNDGNYEPGNCRWATRSEQQGNTRRSRWFIAENKTCQIVSNNQCKFAKQHGLKKQNISTCLQGKFIQCGGWKFRWTS
jgi:hypothetical protein